MIETINAKLIVNIAIAITLIGTCLVPIIDSVSNSGTEEKMMPTDVTNGELFEARNNAPDGQWVESIYNGYVEGTFDFSKISNRLYVDSTFEDKNYKIGGRLWDDGQYFLYELFSYGGGERYDTAYGSIEYTTASLYNISESLCMLEYNFFVTGGFIDVHIFIGQGNKDEMPSVAIRLTPQNAGIVAYDSLPEITTNGYKSDQVFLGSGLTTSATTEGYHITGTTTSGAMVVDRITANNTLVGYLDESETQPVYMFNESKDSNTFAPLDNDFIGLERVEFTYYYNVKDVTIYQKQNVAIESPYKSLMMIAPLLMIVAVIVFVVRYVTMEE